MSHRPIARSPDLKRLRDEEFDIAIVGGNLVMRDVPYVTESREVKRGSLVAPLQLADDVTAGMADHTIMWTGEYPCDQNGRRIERIMHQEFPSPGQEIGNGLFARFSFSAKKKLGNEFIAYVDYYEKMTTYAAILSGPAQALEKGVTAQTAPFIPEDADASVFKYVDTASSRAAIDAVTLKLSVSRIAIIGLGGTGSYVLDLTAKTPVTEIHLFDGDRFLQHNAFRSPGAPSGEDLAKKPYKVDYFADIYSKMRHGIVPHATYITRDGVDDLKGFDFAFLCMEGSGKRAIVERLVELGIPFIDVGMGLQLRNGSLTGQLRTTLVTAEGNHVGKRIPFAQNDERNEYDTNIQIADLNALNAALAVVRWKRHCGFYADLEREHYAVYVISGNDILNEDQAA